jgi:hypothetical protein
MTTPCCFHYHYQSHPRQPRCCNLPDKNNTEQVVTLKVLNPNVFRIKYSPNLIVPKVVCSEIVDKHNHLNYKTSKCMVTWEALLDARESTLHATHPPLTCLPKRCVHIRDAEEVITHIVMKMSSCPFSNWPNKCAMRSPTSGESLVNTYLVVANLPLHLMQKMRRQTTICPTTRKVDCSKKYLSIRTI